VLGPIPYQLGPMGQAYDPLLFIDTFNRADGAAGNGWLLGNIVSNKLSIPVATTGSDLLTDGAFELWNSPSVLTDWTFNQSGGGSLSKETSIVHGGSFAARFNEGTLQCTLLQTITITPSIFGNLSVWVRAATSGLFLLNMATGVDVFNATNVYTQYNMTRHMTTASYAVRLQSNDAGNTLYWDDAHLLQVNESTMFALRNYAYATAVQQVDITLPNGGMGGLVQWADANNWMVIIVQPLSASFTSSTATHQLHVAKKIAGVTTAIASISLTYVPGATLKMSRDSSRLYTYTYNGSVLGSNTVSDTVFDTCKKWGCAATVAAVQFDNYIWYPN